MLSWTYIWVFRSVPLISLGVTRGTVYAHLDRTAA
jgi:hypothetical protein